MAQLRPWRPSACFLFPLAAAGQAVDGLDSASYYMAGMWAGREQIRSAEFTAQVENSSGYSGQVFCAAEFSAGNIERIRFDWRESTHSKLRDHSVRSCYVLTGDYAIGFQVESVTGPSQVSIYPPADKRAPKLSSARAFDVRTVGLANRMEHLIVANTLSGEHAIYQEKMKVARAQEHDGVCDVVLTAVANDRVRRELSIDSNQGHCPVEMEEQYLTEQDGWRLVNRNTMSWQQFDGVWVPANVTMQGFENGSELKIAFEWESVNRPLDDQDFDYRDFDLPVGTSVYDHRLGEPPVLVERISEETLHIRDEPASPWLVVLAWTLGIGVPLLAIMVTLAAWRAVFKSKK